MRGCDSRGAGRLGWCGNRVRKVPQKRPLADTVHAGEERNGFSGAFVTAAIREPVPVEHVPRRGVPANQIAQKRFGGEALDCRWFNRESHAGTPCAWAAGSLLRPLICLTRI